MGPAVEPATPAEPSVDSAWPLLGASALALALQLLALAACLAPLPLERPALGPERLLQAGAIAWLLWAALSPPLVAGDERPAWLTAGLIAAALGAPLIAVAERLSLPSTPALLSLGLLVLACWSWSVVLWIGCQRLLGSAGAALHMALAAAVCLLPPALDLLHDEPLGRDERLFGAAASPLEWICRWHLDQPPSTGLWGAAALGLIALIAILWRGRRSQTGAPA